MESNSKTSHRGYTLLIMSGGLLIALCVTITINFLATFFLDGVSLFLFFFEGQTGGIYSVTICLICTALTLFVIATIRLLRDPNLELKQGSFHFPIQIHSIGFKRLSLTVWGTSYSVMTFYLVMLWVDGDIEGVFALLAVLIMPLIVSFISWVLVAIQAWIIEGFSSDIKERKLESSIIDKVLKEK